MNKKELIKLHEDLNTLELVLGWNRIAGHDTASAIESIQELQAIIEKLTETAHD